MSLTLHIQIHHTMTGPVGPVVETNIIDFINCFLTCLLNQEVCLIKKCFPVTENVFSSVNTASTVSPWERETVSCRHACDEYCICFCAIKGERLRAFPDVAFVRVKTDKPETDFAYSLIRDKAYLSVTSLLSDEKRDNRDYAHDTLTVVKGLEGSYPNFFFVVEPDELADFTSRIININTLDDYERFAGIYGIRRTNDSFWETADWFQDEYAQQEPVLSGLFDLNRYANR